MGQRSNKKKAQKNDGIFISAYAENSPEMEDIAESFLPWLLLRCLPDRISSNDKTKIQKAIPNRLEYFDSLNFSKADLYPISSIKGCRKPNQINIKVAQSLNTGSKIFNELKERYQEEAFALDQDEKMALYKKSDNYAFQNGLVS